MSIKTKLRTVFIGTAALFSASYAEIAKAEDIFGTLATQKTLEQLISQAQNPGSVDQARALENIEKLLTAANLLDKAVPHQEDLIRATIYAAGLHLEDDQKKGAHEKALETLKNLEISGILKNDYQQTIVADIKMDITDKRSLDI